MKCTPLINTAKYMTAALMLLALTGCAAGPTKKSSIEDRVHEYWQLMLAGDYLAAYEYMSPGYRSSVNSNRFQRTMLLKKVKWDDAEYIEGNCTDITCKVSISLKYTVFSAVPGVKSFNGSQKIIETWVQADGIWYLVPES